jgi:hypothetical protein
MADNKADTEGVAVNKTPLYGAGAFLLILFAVAFFACPLSNRRGGATFVRTARFTPPAQPAMHVAAKPAPKLSPPPPATPPRMVLPPCEVCAEPAERYIKSIQTPFPENRNVYEAPRMASNLPPPSLYSDRGLAPYALRKSESYLQR